MKMTMSDGESVVVVDAGTLKQAAQRWVDSFEWPEDWTAQTNEVSIQRGDQEIGTFSHNQAGEITNLVTI